MTPLAASRDAACTPRTELAQLAQNLARNCGWGVFPCGENKTPSIAKKAGGRGCLDATTDPAAIARMFSYRNAALIEIATGEKSGFDVLDVDVKHDAASAWLTTADVQFPPSSNLSDPIRRFPPTVPACTSDAEHESHIARGVDTRGEGGYVVSWSAAGFPCTDHSPVAEWPAWLLEALFYKPEPEPVPDAQGSRLRQRRQ